MLLYSVKDVSESVFFSVCSIHKSDQVQKVLVDPARNTADTLANPAIWPLDVLLSTIGIS